MKCCTNECFHSLCDFDISGCILIRALKKDTTGCTQKHLAFD